MYNPENFYDNKIASERKNHTPKIKDKSFDFKNTTVIVIDDSFFTGKTLSVISDTLKEYTNEILFFSIINLANQVSYTEQIANSYYFNMQKNKGLIDVLNKSTYIPTTHMLRTMHTLSKQGKNELLQSVNVEMKNKLIDSYRDYIGSEL